ncbi:hypothetical protein G9P44_000073 [Scheffersomyces stipitis]|nr:hypothetical protein G9P44_000073 [Scheffersomyces stipitis]
MYRLPSISLFPSLSKEEKVEVLAHLFERCETLTELIFSTVLYDSNTTFASYTQLIEAIRTALRKYLSEAEETAEKTHTAIDAKIAKIIAAHPRLGGSSKASAEKLSQHSSSEQKSLQTSSAEEASLLVVLNDEYESVFPGLRYVVFVNGRSRPVVMENMRSRIARNDIQKEREEAFEAMCDIAKDRASKLVEKI